MFRERQRDRMDCKVQLVSLRRISKEVPTSSPLAFSLPREDCASESGVIMNGQCAQTVLKHPKRRAARTDQSLDADVCKGSTLNHVWTEPARSYASTYSAKLSRNRSEYPSQHSDTSKCTNRPRYQSLRSERHHLTYPTCSQPRSL